MLIDTLLNIAIWPAGVLLIAYAFGVVTFLGEAKCVANWTLWMLPYTIPSALVMTASAVLVRS